MSKKFLGMKAKKWKSIGTKALKTAATVGNKAIDLAPKLAPLLLLGGPEMAPVVAEIEAASAIAGGVRDAVREVA
jgi:hypothetical protein